MFSLDGTMGRYESAGWLSRELRAGPMLLSAQYIIPIIGEPLVGGAVLVRDGVIRDIGEAERMRLRYGDEEMRDFGAAAILPGLIDLHTHMENSVLRGIVPDQPYVSWIQAVRRAAARLDVHDWHASAIFGGLEALSAGITCVADISATGASCSAMTKLGLRGIVFREVGTMDKRRVDDSMKIARNDIVNWGESVDSSRIGIGIAPREAFDCHPAVFTDAARIAREENIPLSLYLAASREEYDFIRWGTSGLSVDNMQGRRGYVEIPPWLPTGVSPVRYLVNWGAFEADNVIAAHCVHVDGEDIRKLQEYDVAVAICPRSNAQLSMGVAPLLEFIRSGLRVGLGTGYAVATDSSDIIKEMRYGMLLNRAMNPGRFVAPETMLRMATIDAARSLKLDDRIGSIEIGKCADLTAIDLSGSRQGANCNPVAVVVNSSSSTDVLMTMVDGKIRYEKDKWNVDVEVARDIARVIDIRGKLRK